MVPEAVMPTTPVSDPEAAVMVPSVSDPPSTAPVAVMEVAAVIAPEASLHLESLKHPGRSFDQLEGSIRSLGGSNRITDNTITSLRAWTIDGESALVQLGCRTTTESAWRPVPTKWVFKVEATPGGDWIVKRIAFASLAGQAPTSVLR